MLSQKILKAINTQINKELYAAYVYQGMANYLNRESLRGMSAWMQKQAAEELEHVQKLISYVYDRGEHVELMAVDAPRNEYESALNVFEEGLAHEKSVSASISELVFLAREEKDISTENFFSWFVSEQVEEEANFSSIVDRLKKVDGSAAGLIMIDGQLGERE